MASSYDEPPIRRKRKAPDEVITKNVVVLRSSQVCERDGVVLILNTSLKIPHIKKNGQYGKFSFTKSTSSTEMERSLQQTFPFLAESNSRIYSAKAVDGKSKLDFCGQRRMWSGEETNRIITGNRALYIYCKEEISKHCPLLPAQVENLQISGIASSSDNWASSSDNWDSGFEPYGISQDNSSDLRRVPLFNNNITNSPADGAFDEDISNLDIQVQLSFSMQEDLEKTYQNYESSDNSIFGLPFEAVPANSNVEAEEANYGAEQGNLIQKIGPSSGPVEGGGNFLITVSEELPDCIDSGFAYFGSNHAVLTKLNKFTFEGIIPAAQQPGVVRVCVYSDTNRFLGETDFEYEDMMDRVAFHAVQLGSEGVSKLFVLMGKHSINMWNQSSSVKQVSELSGQATGALNDSCQERSSLAEDIVIADGNDDLAQDLQDLINWLSEENYHPVHTNRGMWLKISKVANGLCKKLAFSEDVDPQESEEDYFADAENSSCTSSDDDDGASLSDLAGWSECLNDSPLSLPLVYTRLSKSQEANPKAESTQLLNKPVNIELDVSHGIPATVAEGFTSEPSIGDNKYVGSGDFLEWNTPSPESKKTKVNAVNEDQDTEQDLSQEWVFSSEEGTSCTRLASQDDNSMLDLLAIDVDIKGSLYQDDELLKTPHTENAKSQNVELSLSITSMQKSATHDGPSTQNATQSPTKDPLQDGTGNRKSNVVPSQHSNKDITDNSGQEWAKSAITEGLDSWFDLCEIEDGGKNEHSRWEMLSTEPDNTDGGVEEDNLDREPEQGLFSEEGNLYTHLPLPDDTSVQSVGPEVENEESQDSPMLVRHPSFMLPGRIKDMASAFLKPLPRKRKGPDEEITKNVVVLKSHQVHERNGVVFMPNTTLEMSAIKKLGQCKKITFTKSTSPTDMQRKLEEMFPFLSEASERFYCAKAVESRSRLDFCGCRCVWSGAFINKNITGNSALYIYCEEVTLLTAAVKNGHTDIVKLLLKKGADVNNGVGEDTPLTAAVKNGHTDIVRLLLENGADVNKGALSTPLIEGVQNGHSDIVRLLLENGADVNKGLREDTPLTAAVINGNSDSVSLLLENGIDVNKGVREGTPLAEAVKNGHTDLVRLLIENGGDVNYGGLFGSTSLTDAARIGHNDIVRLLVEKGADFSKEGGSTELSLERCVDVVDVQLREKKKTSPANSRKYENEPREISFDKNREDEAEENDHVDTELSLVSSYPCYGQY